MKKIIDEENYNSFAQLTNIATHSKGVDDVLKMICEICDSSQIFLFEFSKDKTIFRKTYQYSVGSDSKNLTYLKDESVEQISLFLDYFKEKKPIYIDNVEDVKVSHPSTYSILKSQGLQNVLATPMILDNTLEGFIAIYNLNAKVDEKLLELTNMYCIFVARSVSILNLEKENNFLKTHDPMTSALNRKSLEIYIKMIDTNLSLGIVSCDISELSSINKDKGYSAGNDILIELSDVLIHIFKDYPVFRTGSDEFLIICSDISKYDFDYLISVLKRYVGQSDYHFFIGTAFKMKDEEFSVVDLINLADKDMFEDKTNYYCDMDDVGKTRERRAELINTNTQIMSEFNLFFDKTSYLKNFIIKNHFDVDVLVNSMSLANHYTYFGDMQTNTFYVSEPLCKILGINSPIVRDLLNLWEKFIPNEEDVAMYRADIEDVIANKRTTHDLRYRIQDLSGNEFWIRCFGIIKWNEDNTKPLFFAGAISRLNHNFTVDPVTDLPKEQMFNLKINECKKSKKYPSFIGFKINSFEEINSLRGRNVANSLLKDIANKIVKEYYVKMELFRLDGLRFLGIVYPEFISEIQEIAMGIKEIIRVIYREYNIAVRFPSVMGIIDETPDDYTSSDIVSDIISLIEVAKSYPEEDFLCYSQMVQNHKNKNLMMMAISRDVADDFNNFYTVIQPVVSAKTHKVVSGELLMRWSYNGENISPMTFIPMLEQQGLIIAAGKWIFEQAVCHCKRLSTLQPDFYLNFNISYYQILDNSFLDFMKQTLEKWQLNPERLVAELTETHYNDHPVQLNEFIESCRELNMRVALDDFGVGYSSLDLLLQYHSDIVKLDRSLVQRMSASEKSNDFITSIVYACHKFGKTVCVEGVETKEEARLVSEAGCDVIQGYYFYKPMEVSQVYELLSKGSTDVV